MIDVTEEVKPPRVSALFCWPVRLLNTVEQPANLHCTAAYIQDVQTYHNFDEPPVGRIVREEFISAAHLLPPHAKTWRLVDVTGVGAFGPEKNVPVLTIDTPGLVYAHRRLREGFDDMRIGYASDFEYSPHVTVPLEVLIDPPKQVILGPMELWYCEDAPVVL